MYYFDAKYNAIGAIKAVDIARRFSMKFPTYPY
jgi:hypothetical protein